MHSILESDGVSSDPNEVLCHMGTLIIEGRTPKSAGESDETAAKSAKPYSEGPHCPNFMKLHNKDTHTVHKCTENNISCIRYNNLKQHLQTLQQKSSSVCIEVSLGPDCLCGELRSQSTLVSGQSSKRDVILEQWKITIGHKQLREPSSQMSVMNLYQAVRSLLHFSQLTAWYMSNNGMKPANVIYRVGVPEDATFICDDNFVSHDFPVTDINKLIWMKISVKTLPRMEKIPSVFCPQHHETGHGSQEPREKSYLSGGEPLHSKFAGEKKEELLESALALKFQGVRKKTHDSQERKRKKYIILNNNGAPMGIENCSGGEFLDGMPVDVKKMSPEGDEEYFISKRMFQGDSMKFYLGESSKAEYKKSKLTGYSTDIAELVKPQMNFESFDTFSCNYFEQKVADPTLQLMMGLNSFSYSKSKSDFRTKGKKKASCSGGVEQSSETEKTEGKTVIDILDDRMQISCAISGKHHCKWECEEENDLNEPGDNVEKPKRRRSLSRARGSDAPEEGRSDSEKILHGKFKEIDGYNSCLQEQVAEEPVPSCSQIKTARPESPPKPKITVDISNSTAGSASKPQTPKIESLPISLSYLMETSCPATAGGSSPREPSPTGKVSFVRTESFESFRKGCAFARDSVLDGSSESEGELSDEEAPETSNPFLAAILRSTRKSKTSKPKNCDSSVKSSGERVGKGEKSKDAEKAEEERDGKDGKAQSEKAVREPGEESSRSPRPPVKNLDLKKKSCRWKEAGGTESSAELLPRSLCRMKSHFHTQDLNREERTSNGYEDLDEEIGSNNLNSTKTIPVPSAHDKLKFRRSLDSAAQLVFHRCSGLPLTSSPAPVRRNNSSFSFDSTLNSVSAIKSALFEPSNSLSSEDENESEGSLKSPASPGAWSLGSKQINYHSLSPLPLLGSFEESVLNGRLEPVSTVQGFTAELGASGSFCPRHLHLPVTVFFYTLGDNDKVSAPYLGHINLGKKGYNVPRSGTIQVTLFNPLRTVVKMFVVVYDLHDMPANSHTFLRQRTLYVPASSKETTWTDKKETPFDQEDYHKYLRYLIHLRFVSGKTGRIYLHTDIRMVIFRKADEDTATALDDGETYELRSHTHGPLNPKFSPRK